MRGNPGLTLLAAALGVMMVAIDGTIVAVANPAIQAHLGASLADIQWVTNGYLLALAVTLITIGKIGDRFGHKKVFLTGIVGFGATSAAIGLSGSIANSITMIIAFRILQGVFGAMLQPTALALIRETFPAEKLNGAIGIWGGVIGASSAAGPIVGGLLVQHLNWESCFYVNVPVGLIALAVGLFVLRETPPSPPPGHSTSPASACSLVSCSCWSGASSRLPATAGRPARRSASSPRPSSRSSPSSSASPRRRSRCCRCGCSGPSRWPPAPCWC